MSFGATRYRLLTTLKRAERKAEKLVYDVLREARARQIDIQYSEGKMAFCVPGPFYVHGHAPIAKASDNLILTLMP